MRRSGAKWIALILAILMILTIVLPLLSLLVGASTSQTHIGTNPVIFRNGVQINEQNRIVQRRGNYEVRFNAVVEAPGAALDQVVNLSSGSFSIDGRVWQQQAGAVMISLTFVSRVQDDGTPTDRWNIQGVIRNLTFVGEEQDYILQIFSARPTIGSVEYNWNFDVVIPPSWIERTSSGGGDDWDDEDAFTPNIIVENVVARDSAGNIIRDIDRDTPPFSIEITFIDHGLIDTYRRDFDASSMAAFLLDPGELIPQGATRGTLRTLSFSHGDPPRFVATFNNLLYAGGAGNFVEVTFRAQYSINDERIFGDGAGRFFGISREEDDDDDDELDPFTPFIIIREHSFGYEQVLAGSVFTLAMDFANTSAEVDLNNIIMVVSPVSTEQHQSALTIASATNTYFFEWLPAGGWESQSVDIMVMATASAGSQAVNVEFRYEYVIGSRLENGNISTIIHIPVTQVDRFAVDPITDYSDWLQMGDEGYVVVSFVNLGQSTAFNVSGFILDEFGEQGQTERHGTLDAGESASFDFSFVPHHAGQFEGTIIISYETETGEEVQIETTFSLWVDEPFFPDRPGMEIPTFEPEEPDIPLWRYMLLSVGGLGVAAPTAFYIVKRVKAGGDEDFDEDF
ncbi:MAG: hypothetical protein FWE32_02640 [Oscillospiraceae bacterium]|nr:hypothetical protein [Oscillospiraceae bacterium]